MKLTPRTAGAVALYRRLVLALTSNEHRRAIVLSRRIVARLQVMGVTEQDRFYAAIRSAS